MKVLLMSGAAVLGAIAVAPALAQTMAQPVAQVAPRAPMEVQTRAGVAAKIQEHFVRLDTNRDGFIVKAEADAARTMVREKIRTRVAQRGERREHNRAAAFDRLDSNRDGMISRQEFDSRQQVRVARRAQGAQAPGMGRQMRMMGGRGGLRLHGAMFEMADANRDNRVSIQEATEAALRHFDMADANRDGQLTPDERRMRRQVRMERRPG